MWKCVCVCVSVVRVCNCVRRAQVLCVCVCLCVCVWQGGACAQGLACCVYSCLHLPYVPLLSFTIVSDNRPPPFFVTSFCFCCGHLRIACNAARACMQMFTFSWTGDGSHHHHHHHHRPQLHHENSGKKFGVGKGSRKRRGKGGRTAATSAESLPRPRFMTVDVFDRDEGLLVCGWAGV